ncbi:hypothetical protein AB3S75_008834 [Citrus x aurantiifolia]
MATGAALLSLRSPPFLSNPKTLHQSPCRASPSFLPIKAAATSSSSSLPTLPLKTPKITPLSPLLNDSTRTVTTLLSLSGFLLKFAISNIPTLPQPTTNLVQSVGPLFFAALRERPSGSLNTPLTVVAAGLAKWLDIYSGVLLVRVLLSWFPNIPWERQPLSAIRDLCDPYLNLFRNIIPPVFDTLDVSPLLAFAVLGTLAQILTFSRGA